MLINGAHYASTHADRTARNEDNVKAIATQPDDRFHELGQECEAWMLCVLVTDARRADLDDDGGHGGRGARRCRVSM